MNGCAKVAIFYINYAKPLYLLQNDTTLATLHNAKGYFPLEELFVFAFVSSNSYQELTEA